MNSLLGSKESQKSRLKVIEEIPLTAAGHLYMAGSRSYIVQQRRHSVSTQPGRLRDLYLPVANRTDACLHRRDQLYIPLGPGRPGKHLHGQRCRRCARLHFHHRPRRQRQCQLQLHRTCHGPRLLHRLLPQCQQPYRQESPH